MWVHAETSKRVRWDWLKRLKFGEDPGLLCGFTQRLLEELDGPGSEGALMVIVLCTQRLLEERDGSGSDKYLMVVMLCTQRLLEERDGSGSEGDPTDLRREVGRHAC